MPKINIKIYQYCAGGTSRDFSVDATVVGDLAIHRPVYWYHDGEPQVYKTGWVVTHIPSGLPATRAMPTSYKTRAVIKKWAAEFQRRAADIFDALREGREIDRETARQFFDTGRGVAVRTEEDANA